MQRPADSRPNDTAEARPAPPGGPGESPLAAGSTSEVNEPRDAALQQVALDCLRRLGAGEAFSDESIERAHPELMPDLAQELAELRRIHAARQWADRVDHEEPPGALATTPSGAAAVLTIRCPECHTRAEIQADSDLQNMVCSSCGAHFSLVGSEDEASDGTLPTRIGHFELIEQLGAGGFGVVWKARDMELDRLVAVKLPRRSQVGPGDAEQFFREARAAAQLQHPNIVSVHEVGRADDRIYIVSDLVDGSSLAEWLLQQRLSCQEGAHLCQKVALALEHAHAAGVVHRDLKPANILLDRQGEPHLTDFGLARRRTLETTMTVDGQMLGTPAYMSPEQARGESHTADGRTDIYSLGVILFELLTGELPFRGNPATLLHQITSDEPPSPRSLNRQVPRDLETICLKCLEKDPLRRYATPRGLADDLTHFLRREPIQARPVSKPERLWRWCRRNPRVAALTTAVATSLLVIAALSILYSIHSRATAREARWQQYLSDMHVAMQAWDEGDAERTISALQRHRPVPGEEDLRRFEWFYLWRQVQVALKTPILPQDGRVVALALSPDGQLLAVGMDTYTVDIWHLPTNKKRHTLAGDMDFLKGVAFSPDGQTLAAASLDPTIRLWDTTTGELRHTLEGHQGYIWSGGVAFSPNGKLLASASADRTVRLWDATTGAPLHVLTVDLPDAEFRSVAFSPDGTLVAAGCTDQTAKLWNTNDRSLVRSFTGHAKTVLWVAFSPDGAMLATSSSDLTIKLWNVANGALLRTLSGHSRTARAVAFTPDSVRIASAGDDGTVRLWDVATGKQLEVLRGHSGAIFAAVFSPDGKQLVTGGADATVRFWDVITAREADILHAHTDRVWGLDVHPNGHTIVSGSDDETVKFWDLHEGQAVQSQPLTFKSLVHAVAYSPSGRYLALGDLSGHLELRDAETSKSIALAGHVDGVEALAWSPDERTFASGASDRNVILWDVPTATLRLRLPGHEHQICSVAFSPDGETLITRCQDNTLRIWDPRTGELRHSIDEQAYYFCPAAFSRDGRILASASADLSIKFWDTSTWTVVRSLRGHVDRIKGLAFSPDGRTLASAGDDSQIKLWEVATGEERCTLRGHAGEVEAVRFTPDGQTLVSSGQDGTIRLWRTTSEPAVPADASVR